MCGKLEAAFNAVRGQRMRHVFADTARPVLLSDNLLQSLSHPGIPQYIDYFEEDTATDRAFYIVQVGVFNDFFLIFLVQPRSPCA